MASVDAAAPAIVAAAATPLANIHLTAFNENNIEVWLSEHEDVWSINNVTRAKDKYTLVRSRLPRTIMDVFGSEIGAIGSGPDPYAALCDFLIKNFGKNKWYSYFQLLSCPSPLKMSGPFRCWDNSKDTYRMAPAITMTFSWPCF